MNATTLKKYYTNPKTLDIALYTKIIFRINLFDLHSRSNPLAGLAKQSMLPKLVKFIITYYYPIITYCYLLQKNFRSKLTSDGSLTSAPPCMV